MTNLLEMFDTRAMRFFFSVLVVVFCMEARAQSEARLENVIVRSIGLGVLNEDDLKAQGSKTLAEILRSIPGVDVSSAGGAGQPTSVFIRGAKSEHTLVLIDGFEANDPTTSARTFDFSSLTAENLERVEVFTGPQSARFGADAMGGVINIITKKGRARSERAVSYEGGSYQTHRLSARASGLVGRFDYSLGASHMFSDGFSAAEGASSEEPDSLVRSAISSRFGWKFSDTENLDLTFRLIEAATKLDVSGGPQGDDPNYDSHSRQYVANAKFDSVSFENRLRSTYQAGAGRMSRRYDNDPDPVQAQDYHETFESESSKLETSQKLSLASNSELELLLQYRREVAASNQTFNGAKSALPKAEQSIFGQAILHRWTPSNWTIESAVRHDDLPNHSAAIWNGSIRVVHAGPSTTVRADVGTGFKHPSLFQLYSNFGFRGLKPERATNVDISVEQKLAEQALLSFSYFQMRFEDLVDFDFVNSRYMNIAHASIAGLEAQLSMSPWAEWVFSLATKFMRTRDGVSGLELLRRPRFSATAGVEWRDEDRGLGAELQARFSGDRDDVDPVSFGRIRLPSYTVGSLRLRYDFKTGYEGFLRVENLFNQSYQEIAGYRTSARSYYVGVSAEF